MGSFLIRNIDQAPLVITDDNSGARSSNFVNNILLAINGEVGALLGSHEVKKGFYIQNGTIVKLDSKKVREIAVREWLKLQDGEPNEYSGLSLEDFISLEMEQNNQYTLISEGREKAKQEILEQIRKNGYLEKIDLLARLKLYYEKGYIKDGDLNEALTNFILNVILKLVESPLRVGRVGGSSTTVKNYHDIDHDLPPYYKQVLAFGIVHGLIPEGGLELINKTLKKGGDNMNFLLSQFPGIDQNNVIDMVNPQKLKFVHFDSVTKNT